MNTMLSKLKKLLGQIRGLFPSATPQGVQEFEAWSNSIIELYSPKMSDRSVKFGLAAMLMRLNPTEAYKSKFFFALCLHKGAAAQVAAQIMEDIKNQQKAEFLASQQPAAVPAPADTDVAVQK